MTDILPVRVTQRELIVYAADLRCVARHELAPRGAQRKLDPAGLHPPPQRKSEIDLDQLKPVFEGMGARSADFFSQLSRGAPRIWGAQARQILLLRERYSTQDLDRALGRAADFGALDYAAVERIVAAHAAPRTLDEYVTEETTKRIEETLGQAKTKPRDLTEYDRLPTHSMSTKGSEETPWPSDAEQPTAPTPGATQPTETPLSNDSSDTLNSSG